MKLKPIVIALFVTFQLPAQTPCIDGAAAGFDCHGVGLMAQVTPQELGAESIGTRWINDLWGWTDPQSGKEYALVGMTNGTSFVDISDPVNPVVLGVLKEHNWNANTSNSTSRVAHDGAKSLWRDIKVYENYAYIVSEDPNHGIQVFDLTDLRDVATLPEDFQEAGHYDGVGAVHNIFINEGTGYLYAVGFNDGDRTCSAGGLHIVDLSDPVNPSYAGCFDNEGYVHDTQCVVYQGPDVNYQGQEICFNSNANGTSNTISIVDVTSKESPILLSKGIYSNAFYTHQGWITDDHQYFISNDELDEQNLSGPTRTFIWNIKDLDAPVLLGTYTHASFSIDHNLYVKGNKVYESNYTSGLRILNTLKIDEGKLSEDLHFDTYPLSNAAEFWGTWSNYPFFESGNVIVSDFTGGLFILRPLDLIIEQQPEDLSVVVGEDVTISMSALGSGLDFQWQVDDGSGFSNISDLTQYEDPNSMSLRFLSPIVAQNGLKYRCLISDAYGTQVISEEMILEVIAPLNSDIPFNLKIYPNPTNDVLSIHQEEGLFIRGELIGMDGKRIVTFQLESGLNELNTASLPRGMYLLKLISYQSNTVTRINIQ
jgi:choice-of-anchor B domain-containing protein